MSPTLKSTTVAKALAIVVGLCGVACLVVSGFALGVGDSIATIALSIGGAILVVIAFRTFVRPTPEILRHICGVISFLLCLLLLAVVAAVGHLVLPPGDTWWNEVLIVVLLVVGYFSWEFLNRRLAIFLMGEELASQEKPSDHNET